MSRNPLSEANHLKHHCYFCIFFLLILYSCVSPSPRPFDILLPRAKSPLSTHILSAQSSLLPFHSPSDKIICNEIAASGIMLCSCLWANISAAQTGQGEHCQIWATLFQVVCRQRMSILCSFKESVYLWPVFFMGKTVKCWNTTSWEDSDNFLVF